MLLSVEPEGAKRSDGSSLYGVAVELLAKEIERFLETRQEVHYRGVVVGCLEVVLQGSGSTLHGSELHPHPEEVTLGHGIPEGGDVLAEEVLHLMVAVELSPHLIERVDLQHHGLGMSLAFPAIGQEEERAAKASGEGAKPSSRPVHTDQLNDPAGFVR